MSLEWYCKIMGEEAGPMSAQELVAVARLGRLTRNDSVRRGPDGVWVPAERVRGLFDSQANSTTAALASAELVPASSGMNDVPATARQPRPAKRSVQVPLPKFWVRSGNQIAGPFSEPQLRRLAAAGKLKPNFLLSNDRSRWVRAAQVKGLTFGGASPQAATMSVRSAVWPLTELAPASVAARELAKLASAAPGR